MEKSMTILTPSVNEVTIWEFTNHTKINNVRNIHENDR